MKRHLEWIRLQQARMDKFRDEPSARSQPQQYLIIVTWSVLSRITSVTRHVPISLGQITTMPLKSRAVDMSDTQLSGDLSGWFRHETFTWTYLDLRAGFVFLQLGIMYIIPFAYLPGHLPR